MSIFAIPALIALLSKVGVYALARSSKHKSQTFLWLLGVFAVHNLSEFLVLSSPFHQEISSSLLRVYYVAALFAVAYMCIFAMSVGNEEKQDKFRFTVLSLALVVSVFVFNTNYIIGGAAPVGSLVTAIKGEYYFVFQVLALSGYACIFTTLLKRYFMSQESKVQLKCFYAMFALSPVILVGITVIVMMQLGYQFSAAVLLPFASTFFLLLIVFTEKYNDLIHIQNRLPFSKQRRLEKKLIAVYRSHINDGVSLVDTKNELEKLLIESALENSQNNVMSAANKLGVNRSTFYGILARLDIKRED